MIEIDQEQVDKLAKDIVYRIRTRKFGLDEPEGSIRMTKIIQNVKLMLLQLLGESLSKEEIGDYVEEFSSQFISKSIEVGEASGTIAAQSLLEPITQATLKSQHRAGAKDTGGSASLLQLNKLNTTNKIYKIHFKVNDSELKFGKTQEDLSREYEEVFLGDVLASTYGESRFEPVMVDDYYSQQTEMVYLNHRDIWPKEVVHRFKMDPEKLWDAGLTQLDIYDLLLDQTDLVIIIHPMSTFIFDIASKDGQRNTSFSNKISSLLKKPLKGIKGLNMVGERKIRATEAAPFIYFNKKKNESTLYFDVNVMMNFPIKEFTKRIIPASGPLKILEETLTISTSTKEAYIKCQGEVKLDQTPYNYFLFFGTLTLESIITTFGQSIDLNHLVSNDAHEMIKFIGITAARTSHEFSYSEALNAAGTPLLYQNIVPICRRIFGMRLMPVTPSGYHNGSGITPLERLSFQNYRSVLETEIIKGTKGSTSNLPAAIIVGRRAKIGTSAMSTEPLPERIKQVNELYSIARQEQKYYGKYQNIQFPPFGTLKPLTVLTTGPDAINTNSTLQGF